jgi:dipeptide/tripeptide permease
MKRYNCPSWMLKCFSFSSFSSPSKNNWMMSLSNNPTNDTSGLRGPRLNIIRNVCIFILVMELAERLCFYTFAGSMIVYFRDYLGFSQSVSSAMMAAFNTLVYIFPLLGGYLADAHWGRYLAISVFGFIYFLGTVIITLYYFSCFFSLHFFF